jgi:uncharacterized protein with HEPN domain
MSRDTAYILDILSAARRIQEGVQGITKEEFLLSWMRHSAIIRQIEIVGEATKRLSMPFRNAHPEIPWRAMTGMRDIVIHGYDAVDLDEVWNVATNDIPPLIASLEPLLPPD